MGFLEGLGKFMGEAAARVEANKRTIELYRPEYENMTNQQLKAAYNDLKEKNEKMFCSDTDKARFLTVKTIIGERRGN